MTMVVPAIPRLRGVFHLVAFVAAVAAGIVLVAIADGGRARVAAWIYVSALAAMFGASALYHRYPWRSAACRAWARRLDHSTIFVFIAGTYTPFALLALSGTLPVVVLATVWGGATLGLVLELAWIDAPRWLSTFVYLLVGWVGVIAAPQLVSEVGVAGSVLVVVGGALYTLGALAYAMQRPNPLPNWIGFHEIFHALVVAAATVQFIAVSFVVL
jgi:hemolysin III